MASQTGRTVSKFVKFQIGDSGNVLRDLPLLTIGDVGLDYDQVDVTALADAVKGYLAGQPDGAFEATFRYDTSAAQAASGSTAAPAFSGSTTVLVPLNGVQTPRTVAIYYGNRHYWETGEDVFGIQRSGTTSGYIVTGVKVNIESGEVRAKFAPFPGSSAPAWGTAVLTA